MNSQADTIAKPMAGSFLSLLALSFAMMAGPAGAVPPNDLCANAEVIPANQGFPVWTNIRDITGATTNGDPTSITNCTGVPPTHSIWFTFTPTISHQYTISSCADAPTATTVRDTVMGIYTSANNCLGPMVEIADGCADDSCGPSFHQAAITTTLQAGTKYYIVVWEFGSDILRPDNSSLQLLVDIPMAPPNDSCETATPLTLNQPVRGSAVLAANDYEASSSCFAGQRVPLASGRDVVYSFTAPVTANYSFRVSDFNAADDHDPVLYAIDACPAGPKPVTVTSCLAAANRATGGSVEEIFCLHLTASQHIFIVVDDDNGDGNASPGRSFIIEATLCNRETEPNNTTATATPIACGMEGSINPAGEFDIYSLGIPKTGSRLFAMADGAAGVTSDLNIRVFTANGTLEYDGGGPTANNDEPFGNFSGNVAGTLLTNVPTFLRIERAQAFGATEPYRLYAVIQPHLTNATTEVEPNNNLGQANRAANNYFYGTLAGPAPSSDVDSYEFEADAGDLVFISLDGDPMRNNSAINAALELLDEVGNVLVLVDDNASSSANTVNTSTNNGAFPNSPGEALIYRTAASATYYVRVSINPKAAGGAAAGDYLLSISRNCVPGNTGQALRPTIQSITPLLNGSYQISAVGTPGVTYRLLSSPDLTSWTPVPSGARVANGDGTFQIEDATPPPGQGFYRILWP